jgi:outer membrane protein TolC
VSAGGKVMRVSDVARADVEIATARRTMLDLEGESRVARASLVGLAGTAGSIPADAPPLADSPATEERGDGAGLRADVRAARAEERAAAAELDAAESLADVPRFEVGVSYMQMPAARPGAGAMVSMTLPWLWGAASSRAESAREGRRSMGATREAVERQAALEAARADEQLGAAERSLGSLREQVIPAAERAAIAERASLAGEGFDLTNWLLAERALLQAHIDEISANGAVALGRVERAAALGDVTVTRGEAR